VAADEHADMIVMGTQGRTGLDRLLLGSVAERVIRHASCPVLTVRPNLESQGGTS
jgi:nucleotide-binding universal stress UspA family protein